MRAEPRGAISWQPEQGLPSNGFRPSQRLRKRRDFDQVFAKGRRSADRFFVVVMSPATAHGGRLGLVVSKRVSKRAVDRNRIKRVIRECYRTHPFSRQACDLVVIARAACRNAPGRSMSASLDRHWSNYPI